MRLVKIVASYSITLAFSIIATVMVFKVWPGLFYNVVLDTSKTYLEESEIAYAEPGSEYNMSFIPRYEFLANIVVGVQRENTNDVVEGYLYDETERVIELSQFTPSSKQLQLNIYKRLKPGKEYNLKVVFPETNEGGIPVALVAKGEQPGEIMGGANVPLYLEITYNQFSKKLVGIWFATIFVVSCFFADLLVSFRQDTSCIRATSEMKEDNKITQ